MAQKTSSIQPKINYPTTPSIKYVKKAKMWCKTSFDNTKQVQEWTMEKPSAETEPNQA